MSLLRINLIVESCCKPQILIFQGRLINHNYSFPGSNYMVVRGPCSVVRKLNCCEISHAGGANAAAGISDTAIAESGHNAAYQGFIDPVFGFLPEQDINLILNALALIAVQPSVPVVSSIPGA
jgi:hypothetical protein